MKENKVCGQTCGCTESNQCMFLKNPILPMANQPPHPANNDYAVKVIQERIDELELIDSAKDIYGYVNCVIQDYKHLLEKLKS